MAKMVLYKGGAFHDAMLSRASLGSNVIKEGDFAGSRPILRENTLSLGIRTSGGNMTSLHSYNNTLLNNPVISIIGSSHSISLGLSGAQTLQAKIQAWFDANHGGATINNLGVAGEYTDHWLPTAQGGLADRNIDAALSYNPDIIFVIGPTNDAQFNTPAQATANLQIIHDYGRQRGAIVIIHSTLPRGDYNAIDQQDLADEDALWRAAFTYKYIDLFNSVLRDTGAGIAVPNLTYFQGDEIHLNDAGTTVQANAIIALLQRELRANTAYVQFEIERSDDGATGWVLFDTIIDQQVIRKTYSKEPGYYRVRAMLKDGSYTSYSNVVQVTNTSPTANAGSDQNLVADTTTVNLTGSGSDVDGTIVSYLWTVVSGAGLTLVNANTTTVTVNGLANGQSYTLRLTVTDNNGANGSDDAVITVGSASTIVSRFNFSATEQLVDGFESVFGQPHQAVLTGTQNGITVSTISTTLWVALGSTANDLNGQADTGQAFVFPPEVTRSFFFNYNASYTPGNENLLISGFNPGEVVPLIDLLGSRDASGVAAATRLCDYTLVDANGSTLIHDFNVKGNTENLATWSNAVADSNGQLKLAIYRRLPVDGSHEIGYLNALRITRNI